MCSLTLCTRFVDDPDEWWEEARKMPEEVEKWLDEHEKSMPLGGTYSTKTDADRIDSYRAAVALMEAFRARFPDYADRFLILREWWCYGSEIEQVYRSPEELAAEVERLEAKKALSTFWTPPPSLTPLVRKARIVRKKSRVPLAIEGDDGDA